MGTSWTRQIRCSTRPPRSQSTFPIFLASLTSLFILPRISELHEQIRLCGVRSSLSVLWERQHWRRPARSYPARLVSTTLLHSTLLHPYLVCYRLCAPKPPPIACSFPTLHSRTVFGPLVHPSPIPTSSAAIRQNLTCYTHW